MNEPWLIKDDPPEWLEVSADEAEALRQWGRRVGASVVHLNADAVDLDSATFEPLDAADANPPAAAITRALRNLGTGVTEETEAERDRVAEAAESLSRRFKGRP